MVQPKYPFVVLLLFPEGELGIHCMCHFPFSLVTGMSNKLGKALGSYKGESQFCFDHDCYKKH